MKRIILPALAALVLTATMIIPHTTAAVAGKSVTFKDKNVTAYLFNSDSKKSLRCLFRTDMNLPYINAADYLNQIYAAKFTTEKNDDGTYNVYNKNGSIIVNPEKDTVHFDAFEKVVLYDTKPGLGSDKADYIKDNEYKLSGSNQKGIDFDLGKYKIDITAKDGNVYFPLTTIADIFAQNERSAVYIDNSIYFHSLTQEPYFKDDPLYSSLNRDESLIDYTYNELCFAVDCLYGQPSDANISESIGKNGLDKTLGEFSEATVNAKQLLQSKNKIDMYFALLYLDSAFSDGGHTSFSAQLTQAAETMSGTAVGNAVSIAIADSTDERMDLATEFLSAKDVDDSAVELVKSARIAGYIDYDKVKQWNDELFLVKNGNTAVFVLDKFDNAAVKSFKWSLDYAKENGIGNFVIDLSANPGGPSDAARYMLAVMTGSGDLYMKNTATDDFVTEKAKIDKNLDGKFDKKDDAVKYDFNYAILTSRCSFSNGNLLVSMAQDHGIKILGESTGGGACIITKQYYPEPYGYTLCSPFKLVSKDGKTLDGGANPDVELVSVNLDGMKDYSGLYVLENIEAALKGDPINLGGQSTSTKDEKEDNTEKGSSEVEFPMYLWVVIGLTAAAVIFAIFIFIRRIFNN